MLRDPQGVGTARALEDRPHRAGADRGEAEVAQRLLVTIKPRNKKMNLSFDLSVISRPNLAPRPVPTGQARKMVQNAFKISSGDQF